MTRDGLAKCSLIATLIVALAGVGCGPSGPEIASVEGKITMDGKPLSNATVIFIPENGRAAAGRTDKDGNYVLNFTEGREGAIPGKNTIRITTLSEGGQTEDGQPTPGSPETIPAQYNIESNLEFTVEPGKKNIANFELSSKGRVTPSDE